MYFIKLNFIILVGKCTQNSGFNDNLLFQTHTSDSAGYIPHASGHTSQFMDLVMAATTVKPTGCSYKSNKFKSIDHIKFTKWRLL